MSTQGNLFILDFILPILIGSVGLLVITITLLSYKERKNGKK